MTEGWEVGLAATKLGPPVPPGRLVRRSRLDDALDAAVAGGTRLVLVSAPAGSGKSTLLASWAAGRAEAVAWLQVEDSDSDPARFWTFLTEAIGRVRRVSAASLRTAISGSRGDDLVVVPALVNELAARAEPLVVVIDDYHLIDNVDVHRGMERLIELGPPQISVVVAARIDPPFRLGRLRVRGQLAEVRAADLRFDADEASSLLAGAGWSLERATVEELCGRTEGWAAGLVLAGLSLARADDPSQFVAGFGGDDQLVVEYLRDELLATVSADDRRRLLETSILEQLSGALVDAVTATAGGAVWLQGTAAANQLLIGLDRTGTWFRYHQLLRDLLRLEAARAFPDRLGELHARAAAWFEAQRDHRHAISHRLAAGDAAAAARLMGVYGFELMGRGQVETLRRLLEQLGPAAETRTSCALLSGWCEFIGGRYSLADRWLHTALAVAPDGFDETWTTSLRINLALARGDVATGLRAARHVLAADQLEGYAADLATAVGAAHAWAGQADQARRALDLAAEKAEADDAPSARILALVYRAIVELDDGPRREAHAAAARAVDTARRFGLSAYHGVAPAYAIRARSALDPEDAQVDAQLALESARRASTPLVLGYVLAVCGDTLIDLGDANGRPLLDEARSILGRCPDPGIAGRYLARSDARHGTRQTPHGGDTDLVEPLTDRELAVLRYLPTTMSQRDIASELYVSLNTVKTHCQAIYRKLRVSDRRAAVQTARDLHLL
jgi:LuxR family transcriptional regulator, maltose regulon positive regulatory protein